MDAISYSYADKQAKRIKKFIENPDSTSGILTQPSVIQTGETVNIPAGRTAIMANAVIDGTVNIDGTMFIPTGSSVDFSNGIKVNGTNIALSIPTSYHLLQGNLSVSNEVITNGFSTTLYTGNGSTQSINTGIDMNTQWGNDVSETFGGLSWIKSRSLAQPNELCDTVRGINKQIQSNTTSAELSASTILTSFNVNGFNVSSDGSVNQNLATYASWNFQTTHRRTGVTNHGKAYTEHYNPFTGFTIIKYEGSGIAGHEIPHMLGRKLGFVTVKNLSSAIGWQAQYREDYTLTLNATSAEVSTATGIVSLNDLVSTVGTDSVVNTATNQYIMYGWANSYLDETDKLIGNYEVGVYQGTGLAGNKITTKGKPAWIMIKRLDSTGNWNIYNNQVTDGRLIANLSNTESTYDATDFVSDGFILKSVADSEHNASGGQYLYMVVYDNDSGSGKSKYPKATDTTNVQINNAIIPLAHGVDSNGSKNSMVIANETITGLTYTQGKNYLYKTDTGYGVTSISPSYGKTNPLIGDFYNVITNKWYSNTNAEITESRNYLNHIVHADQNGQVTYVEELPKIEYKDIIKANKYIGSNAVSLSVAFDLTTTPITIKGKIIGTKALVRTSAGVVDIYLDDNLKGIELKLDGITNGNQVRVLAITDDKITIETSNSSGTATSYTYTSINGVGE